MIRQLHLGRLLITPAARDTLDPADVMVALRRHAQCDWGDLCAEDRQENEFSLANDCRILSSYHDRNNTKFWIITERDRSATTILLPDDY